MLAERESISQAPPPLTTEQEKAIGSIKGAIRVAIITALGDARNRRGGVLMDYFVDLYRGIRGIGTRSAEEKEDLSNSEIRRRVNLSIDGVREKIKQSGLFIRNVIAYNPDIKKNQSTYYLLTERELEVMLARTALVFQDNKHGFRTLRDIATQTGVPTPICLAIFRAMLKDKSVDPEYLDPRRPNKIFLSPSDSEKLSQAAKQLPMKSLTNEFSSQPAASYQAVMPDRPGIAKLGEVGIRDLDSRLRGNDLLRQSAEEVPKKDPNNSSNKSKSKEQQDELEEEEPEDTGPFAAEYSLRPMLGITPKRIIRELGESATDVILSHLANGHIKHLTQNLHDFLTNMLPVPVDRKRDKILTDLIIKSRSEEEFFFNLFVKTLKELWSTDKINPKDPENQKRSVGYCLKLKQQGYTLETIETIVCQYFSLELPEEYKSDLAATSAQEL